ALQIANKPPANWEVVTRDLFKDFGPMVLRGIAFTPMDGTAGLFDHVYLGRTIADLDRADAPGLGKVPLKKELTRDQLEKLWQDRASPDVCRATPAHWTLVAGARQSVPFMRPRLQGESSAEARKRIARLIKQLSDDQFAAREEASRKL